MRMPGGSPSPRSSGRLSRLRRPDTASVVRATRDQWGSFPAGIVFLVLPDHQGQPAWVGDRGDDRREYAGVEVELTEDAGVEGRGEDRPVPQRGTALDLVDDPRT